MANYQLISISSILSRLGQRTDGRDTNVFWTQDEKMWATKEALDVWQCMVGQWQGAITVVASEGTFISVPRQLASVSRVTYGTTPLKLVSLFELDRGWPGWQLAVASTPYYWAPNGVNEIAIHPHPSGGGEFTFYGYLDLLELLPSDFIYIGNEELTRVLDYAKHYLSFKEGMTEVQSSSEALTKYAQAAMLKNGRIAAHDVFKKYRGKDHDTMLRPLDSGGELGVKG